MVEWLDLELVMMVTQIVQVLQRSFRLNVLGMEVLVMFSPDKEACHIHDKSCVS